MRLAIGDGAGAVSVMCCTVLGDSCPLIFLLSAHSHLGWGFPGLSCFQMSPGMFADFLGCSLCEFPQRNNELCRVLYVYISAEASSDKIWSHEDPLLALCENQCGSLCVCSFPPGFYSWTLSVREPSVFEALCCCSRGCSQSGKAPSLPYPCEAAV